MSNVKGPRDVLRALFALRDRLSAAPSVQGALELLGIPYTGSGVMASRSLIQPTMGRR